MQADPLKHSTQAFRSHSTAGTTCIPTMMDDKTGQLFILWDDIMEGFANAISIKNGETLVPCMKDEHLQRIVPWRIKYHPEAVLEVVEGSYSPLSDFSWEASRPTTGYSPSSSLSTPLSTPDADQNVAELSIVDINTYSQSLAEYTRGMHEDSQSSLQEYNQLYNNYFTAIMTGQQMQAASIKESMDVHFDRLQIEMDKNKALQEELVKMQRQMQQQQEQAKEEIIERQKMMDEKQDRILQMQQQALDRLVLIQSKVQTVLTQTYELHEYPIPRLFIVLPKTEGLLDKLKKPFTDDFRLYFLCECGTHTMSENCSTPHEIHLAKHEGYELEKPTKFFEQYGTYLLAMMYMVKYGINAAGIFVPVLAKLDIADGVLDDLKDTDHLRKHAKPLVDATIDYLHGIKKNTEPGAGLSEDHTDFDSLEALEGADLRQLESYLKNKDQGFVLGNLYRIVTQDGHVKWVCIDHYRTISKESAIQELRDIVAVNHGVFVEGTGKVEIKIATNTLAKQFYDALIKARVVQELEITLEWDATMEELQALANAVTRASVVHLVLNGTRIKGPALDFGNRSRRFDPIAQLAFNGRVQSLRLRGLEGFFSRVTSPALALTSKFREFSVDSRISHSDKAIKSCNEFLDHCPSLKRVELRFQKQYPVTKTVGDILGKLRKLKSLMFDRDNFSFAARVSEGNLQDMFLTIERLGSHGLEDFKFIRQSDLTQLHIKYTPQKADETQLVDVLRHNPRLYALRIGCAESRCLAILHLVISTRAALLQEERPCQLRTFELMDERLIPFEERGLYDERTLIHTSLSFAKDSLEFDMQTWIRLQCKSVVKEEDPITDFVREYGWSIVRLKIPQSFNDCFASTLYDITKEKGSRLEKVDLYPYSLTSRGLDHLDKIIDNSPSLVGFRLLLKPKNWAAEVEYTQLVLTRFGKRVTGLFFLGDTPEKWLPQIASSFPTRSCFPVLTELDLFLDMDTIPSNCVSWIATVVSTPPQHLEYPQQSSTSDVVEQPSSLTVRGSGTPTAGCTPLVRFTMERVILRPEEWGAVIKALDFSTLEVLSFAISNFSGEQLKLLVDRVPDSANETVPLRMLSVGESDVVKKADPRVLEGMLGILREKVPLISIKQ